MSRMPKANRSTNSLAAGISALAREEGRNDTRYAGAAVFRITAPEAPTATFYPAAMFLVGAGEKQGTLRNEIFAYNADHYLVVTSPLPMLCKTIASSRQPLLSLGVEIELAMLRELLLEMSEPLSPAGARSFRPVFRAPLPRDLEDAGARLLACLTDERRTRALARQTIREMLFLVLEGPYGDSLRALAEGSVGQLAHVLRHMSKRYEERLSVGELAAMAHMSIPTFHQHFKAMTATSPLQYMKSIRLTQARQMLQAGARVKAVAHDVGYESESQFSREYRRFFGFPPSGEGGAYAPAAPQTSRLQDNYFGRTNTRS
jgi:AraC-like DNA-binding protein